MPRFNKGEELTPLGAWLPFVVPVPVPVVPVPVAAPGAVGVLVVPGVPPVTPGVTVVVPGVTVLPLPALPGTI